MPINVTMPALSPTMEEGNLAKWLVKEGDKVESGDVIAEIETDKATMEVEAADEGTVGKILVPEGTDGVKVNAVIAVLLEEGESADDIGDVSNTGGADESAAKDEGDKAVNPKAEPKSESRAPTAPASDKGERIFATPLARRMAEEAGLDLKQVKGSGPRGRIVKEDVAKAKEQGTGSAGPQQAAAQKAAMPAASAPAVSGPDAKQLADMMGMEYEEQPNSNMRKVIAKRLLESKQTVPHFYLTVECRLDALLAARKQMNDEAGGEYKLSVNDFVIKAVANALKTYPAANTAWTEAAILQYKHADISVAVATPNGLITPIIKKAEQKGLRDISTEMKDLAARARDNKLKPEEFQGGTFSVSNLGMFGVSHFQAIINPPQACILAVGAGEKKPFVDASGEMKVGTFMSCTLSVDHRAVDGAVGAEYLKVFKQNIENPLSMLL